MPLLLMRKNLAGPCLLLSLAIVLFAFPVPSLAQSVEEMAIMGMFYREDELVVTATRSEKPLSQAAENMTVITAREMEEMNAHTVADVLNHVTGIQMDPRGGVGSAGGISIQGSNFTHVLVLTDGIKFNNMSNFFADIGAIPVQHIERIEIIKGPASSAWGSSLGGVVNIITKQAGAEKGAAGGTLSSSFGEKDTGDFRAEASGKAGRFGYYLSAGRIESEGFTPYNFHENNNIYTKFRADLLGGTYLTLTFGYMDGSRGMGQDRMFDISFEGDFEYLYSTLLLNSALSRNMDMEISLRTLKQDNDMFVNQISTGDEIDKSIIEDSTEGGSFKLISRYRSHTVILGSDYDEGELESNVIFGGEQSLRRWALYANDTITINGLSITPGLRYDDISTSGSFISPSLGATYGLSKKHLLRMAAARGFNAPPLGATYGSGFFSNPNPDLKAEEVWSYQAGFETTYPRYFWAKATAFRHDVDKEIAQSPEPDGTFTGVNRDQTRRQGVELELETMPVYDLSLEAGYLYQDVEDRKTGESVKDVAEYTIDLGIKYDDRKSLKAVLLGHYIWWNADPSLEGEYDTFIWDLNVTKKIYGSNNTSAEAFLSVHNIFDGSQYLINDFRNPGRWVEAGIRMKI